MHILKKNVDDDILKLSVPSFTIEDVLYGGMGKILICYDSDCKVRLAVKTFKEIREGFSERFLRESLMWIGLGSHPNIVQAFFVIEIKGKPFLFMEYIPPSNNCPNSTLESLLKFKKHIPIETSINFAVQICTALQYANDNVTNFVFRDLKPANILVKQDNLLKITDFGLAKADSQFVSINNSSGTIQYMSPEQREGKSLDQRSDIYSFGRVLYQMVAYRPLFNIRRSIPKELSLIIDTCLQKKLNDRFKSFAAIIDLLLPFYYKVTNTKWTQPKETIQDNSLTTQNCVELIKNKFKLNSNTFWHINAGISSSHGNTWTK